MRAGPAEECGTKEAFERDPQRFWHHYLQLVRATAEVQPCGAHDALEALGKLRVLITQNVDGLHRTAGSHDVIEHHGRPDILACLACGSEREQKISELSSAPMWRCGEIMKPSLVRFGDALPRAPWARAEELARACAVCLIVGTSGVVYPAARMPVLAFEAGAPLCQVDLEATGLTHTGCVRWYVQGPASPSPSSGPELLTWATLD